MPTQVTSCGAFYPSKNAEKIHLRIARQFFEGYTYAFAQCYKEGIPWVEKGKDGVKQQLGRLGNTSRFSDGIKMKVDAAVSSCMELAELNLDTARGKYKDQRKKVRGLEKKFKDAGGVKRSKKKDRKQRIKTTPTPGVQKLAHRLHNARARLQKLTQEVERWEKAEAESVSICFGTRDLFKKQFFLGENGYKDHAAWLADWQNREIRGYFCLGSGGRENNRLARIVAWNWVGDGADLAVQINVNGKKTKIKTHVTQHAHALHFAYENKQAVSIEVVHGGGWHIHFSWDYETFFTPPAYDILGYLGVDFNDGYLTVWHVSADGNPLEHWDYRFKGKTAEETKSNLARGLKQYIIPYAKKHSLLLVIEDLNFTKKKWRDRGKRHNHRLSQWLTGWYQHIVQYRCLEQGVKVRVVNPAYSTIVGYVKYSCGLGLRTHDGAAIVLARRGGDFSERVKSVQMTGPCPRPVRIEGNRHPWAWWATIGPASALQAVNGQRKQNNSRMRSAAGPTPAPVLRPPDLFGGSFSGECPALKIPTLPLGNCAVSCPT